MTQTHRIRTLINRLSRLDGADGWSDDTNPTQLAALGYLGRANRFSRSPSHVADYLGTTRGTMSQTLRALARKGYARELRSETDKRSISYELTAKGREIAARPNLMEQVLESLDTPAVEKLEPLLTGLLVTMLKANDGRAFGICKTCAHYRQTGGTAHCSLLSVALEPFETRQICHEQVPA